MAQMSNYLESGLLNWLFRGNTNNFTRPLNISIALCSNVPGEDATGANMNEVANAGGYARVNLGAPTNALFTEISQAFGALSSGNIDNASAITFPTATADWGYVSGVAIVDSGVYGAGNVLMYGRLANPRNVQTNDTVSFAIGAFDIYFG